jgi:hypothetical protein
VTLLIDAGRRCENMLEDSYRVCDWCSQRLEYRAQHGDWIVLGQANEPGGGWMCPETKRHGHRPRSVYEEFRCPNPARYMEHVLTPDFERRVIGEDFSTPAPPTATE